MQLSDGVRMLSYKSCDPGFLNLRNGSTGIYDCVECALGYYNLASESFSCDLCPSGSYYTFFNSNSNKSNLSHLEELLLLHLDHRLPKA